LNLRDKIAAASFIAAVSSTGCRKLAEQYPEFAAKFLLVPCGLDASWFNAPTGGAERRRELLCVARLDPQKDPMLLLTAVGILLAEGVDLHLTIAGDGSLREEMHAHIAAHGLSRHVSMLGWQTQQQVIDHLLVARALVLSSHDEGLPVVIMEAFALGVPAIAPDVGGVKELVETGVSGWLVPRGDARALADAIRECLAVGPEVLRRMGIEARRRARSHDVRGSVDMLTTEFRRTAE
jgi:glycosyltransferase involved in cell wall biosynthesis